MKEELAQDLSIYWEALKSSPSTIYAGIEALEIGKKIERMFGIKMKQVWEMKGTTEFPLLVVDSQVSEEALAWLKANAQRIFEAGYTSPKAQRLRREFFSLGNQEPRLQMHDKAIVAEIAKSLNEYPDFRTKNGCYCVCYTDAVETKGLWFYPNEDVDGTVPPEVEVTLENGFNPSFEDLALAILVNEARISLDKP